jgi:hypothetical protein
MHGETMKFVNVLFMVGNLKVRNSQTTHSKGQSGKKDEK